MSSISSRDVVSIQPFKRAVARIGRLSKRAPRAISRLADRCLRNVEIPRVHPQAAVGTNVPRPTAMYPLRTPTSFVNLSIDGGHNVRSAATDQVMDSEAPSDREILLTGDASVLGRAREREHPLGVAVVEDRKACCAAQRPRRLPADLTAAD